MGGRLRGPKLVEPEGTGAWPLLNEVLFGGQLEGGHNARLVPGVVPFDWAAAFGRDAPRTIEIGFNRGRFIEELAEAWPDHNHLGIEIQRRFAWLLTHRMAGMVDPPRNIRLVWADAKLITSALFPPGSIEAIFINFPDPWWKHRHVKRRLVDLTFASDLARVLAPGGRIWVKTDVPHIAAEIEAALASVEALEGPVPFEQDALPLTFRERKCVARGMPIDRFFFTCRG